MTTPGGCAGFAQGCSSQGHPWVGRGREPRAAASRDIDIDEHVTAGFLRRNVDDVPARRRAQTTPAHDPNFDATLWKTHGGNSSEGRGIRDSHGWTCDAGLQNRSNCCCCPRQHATNIQSSRRIGYSSANRNAIVKLAVLIRFNTLSNS